MFPDISISLYFGNIISFDHFNTLVYKEDSFRAHFELMLKVKQTCNISWNVQ